MRSPVFPMARPQAGGFLRKRAMAFGSLRAARSGLAAAVLVGCVAPLVPAHAAQTPAMQMYDEVSAARDQYSDVIWDGKPTTPEALRDIVRALEADIAKLDAPLATDLAEGNLYLRYRRYNLLCDLVRLHARLGEQAQALEAWRALSQMEWEAGDASFEHSAADPAKPDPDVAALKRLPAYGEIAAQRKVAEWWSNAPSIVTDYRAQLPVDERIAGVSLLWTNARNGFAWFDHVPDLDWDAAYREALKDAIAAPDTRAYYHGLMRFVARLHDGHSNVYFPKALWSEYARPGVGTRLVGGKVLVTAVRDPKLREAGMRVGDELLVIDGVSVQDHVERNVRPYVSASTPQDADVRTYDYHLLMGDAATPVTLHLADEDGKAYDVVAPRSGYQVDRPGDTPLFEMRDDGIAVLHASQFEDAAALEAFRAASAQWSHAKGLVLDLRGNGGGSTGYGAAILSHLSPQPLPTTRSRYLDSAPYPQATRSRPRMTWRNDFTGRNTPPALQYTGPVVMLIDARTFSAAEDTADLFQRMHRGKLIGMASGGSSGQPLGFPLPGGGSARICVKRDEAPDGTTFVGKGIQPDIRIEPTQADIRAQRDVTFARAVAELSSVTSPH